ncbi:MAG: response regulator [Gammaproteobacteria bacterium]|nr:response regulator [Gammaproteobacteria bacterium]
MADAAVDNLGKPTILLVDDSRVIRKTIIKMLGTAYNIVETGDGEAGWRTLSQVSQVDVLITDIEMPQLDGYGLICRIRAAEDHGLAEIPIIVITGAEDDITKERAYACGANDFILKPIEPSQLRGCVNAHLEEAKRAELEKAPVAAPAKMEEAIPVNKAIGKLPAIDAALLTLRSKRSASIKPFALDLALRIMPLLDYCNTTFTLGLDKEILMMKKKILAAR